MMNFNYDILSGLSHTPDFFENLFSPQLLFFVLGIISGLIGSDLELPSSTSKFLSLYLIMAIGFKGGFSLVNESSFSLSLLMVLFAGIFLSFIQPYIAHWILKRVSTLDPSTMATIAAQYGSTGLVTFVAACAFLKSHSIPYESYCVVIFALMEAPAIISGMWLAQKHSLCPNAKMPTLAEIFTHGTLVLLLGSFVIGSMTTAQGYAKFEGFLIMPFDGLLSLFLLDMGLLVAKHAYDFKKFSWQLVLFGIYMPLIGALLGLMTGYLLGLNVGTTTIFMVLCASSSYIAVPAAMSLALPDAKASIYLPMSLGITFPFNIVFGTPLYYFIASKLISQ